MTITRKALARRTFLRGVGTAIGLPFLDAMVPALSFGKAAEKPVRMASCMCRSAPSWTTGTRAIPGN